LQKRIDTLIRIGQTTQYDPYKRRPRFLMRSAKVKTGASR
jgi:hypothetical protein